MISLQINSKHEKKWLWLIGILSVVVVALVAFLLFKAEKATDFDSRIFFLPKLNAIINSCVTVFLAAGYYFIRIKKNITVHRSFMLAAFVFSILFLLSYVVYHNYAPKIMFGDVDHNLIVDEAEKAKAGALRYVYFFILFTHIILSTIIIPLALVTLYRGLSVQYARHKKIARITFPLWMYVSITGVLVYLLISPYYPV